jgi:hypothetical protein
MREYQPDRIYATDEATADGLIRAERAKLFELPAGVDLDTLPPDEVARSSALRR